MSAVEELQRYLSQPPPSSSSSSRPPLHNNPVAVAHAALQRLRDEGDPTFLFLRCGVEIVVSGVGGDPRREELLYHCVSGTRRVLLHRWDAVARVDRVSFLDTCRDWCAAVGSSGDDGGVSRAVRGACLSAAASFWKRRWDGPSSSTETTTTTDADPQLEATLARLTQTLRSVAPRLEIVPDHGALFDRLEAVATEAFVDGGVPPEERRRRADACAAACAFVGALSDEFSGAGRATGSPYNLSLGTHRALGTAFQREGGGLDRALRLATRATDAALRAWDAGDGAEEAAVAALSLWTDTVAWDFSLGGWRRDDGDGGSGGPSLARPPPRWRDAVADPAAIQSLFALVPSAVSRSAPRLGHAARQAIAQLCATAIDGDDATRARFAGCLVEGALTHLVGDALARIDGARSEEDGAVVVDVCAILSRIASTFRLPLLSRLGDEVFDGLTSAITALGERLLRKQLSECERVRGDTDSLLEDGWEWREEAWNRLLTEACVTLAEDPFVFSDDPDQLAADDRAARVRRHLADGLGVRLYAAFVTTRVRVVSWEERFAAASQDEDDDDDDVREHVAEVQLEEQVEAVSALGRLRVGRAVSCLSEAWAEVSPRLFALLEPSATTAATASLTPDAAATLEEACLLVRCACSLLTDDDRAGETPEPPLAVAEECRVDPDATRAVVGAVDAVAVAASGRLAAAVAARPDDPRASPRLARTLMWFSRRWAAAYLLPETSTSATTTTNGGVLAAWSDATPDSRAAASRAVAFLVDLCVHYYVRWPLETTVHGHATELLRTLARRGPTCRRLVVRTAALERLVVSHAASAESALGADVEPLLRRHGDLVDAATVAGYQRASHQDRGNVLLALLTVCGDVAKDGTDADVNKAMTMFDCCLRSLRTIFGQLVKALTDNTLSPHDVRARDAASLCVALSHGVARASEIAEPHRVPEVLTPLLPHLSGLMRFYADDLSVCESLLTLFRDYAEHFIAILRPNHCAALFGASADLLRDYGARHCASRAVSTANGGGGGSFKDALDEEQNYSDVLCAVQLLVHLGTKDFIDASDVADVSSTSSKQVTDVVFFGLQQILPVMTRGLLRYPTLCSHFFSLVGLMLDTYPEEACALPHELLVALLDSSLHGMSHADAAVGRSSLRGAAALVREHARSGALREHLARRPALLADARRRLLTEVVVVASVVRDRAEAAASALLPLAAIDAEGFAASVERDVGATVPTEEGRRRLRAAFSRLMRPEVLEKAHRTGYEGRANRVRFKQDFEVFVRDVQSFLVIC